MFAVGRNDCPLKKGLHCPSIMGKICFIDENFQKLYKQVTKVCTAHGIRVQKAIR